MTKEVLFDIEKGGKRFCGHVWSHEDGMKNVVICKAPKDRAGYEISMEEMVCVHCGRRWFLIFKEYKYKAEC